MRENIGVIVRRLAIGAAGIALLPGAAFAQEAGEKPDAEKSREIIVTGTLVRGIAPAGASVVSVSEEAIAATGATTVAQVLQTIPQLASFGTLQTPLANSQEVSVNRPNLRSLPGFNTSGGSTTLVLLDGHRIVGMGNASTSPDPDVIPPGVLERVEIVPDGGSAIYGSDAVAGVMNFVTIKRFDGVKVDGSYGFADNYYRYDANVTAGKDWGSGSLFVSYNYARSDLLLGKDRKFVREFPGTNGFTSLQCAPGNIQNLANGSVVALPAANAPGTANQCDASDFATVYPASKRHSVFAGLTQELSDAITFELRGFYTKRDTLIQNGPFGYTQIITPFPIPGVPSTVSPFAFGYAFGPGGFVQNVSGQFGENDASKARISLDTWGITPTFTVALGSNFQLRAMASVGESTANFRGDRINEAALRRAIGSGAFNPYAPSSANPALLADLTNSLEFGRTKQFFTNYRMVVDGDLIDLPAGAAKIAVGAEYMHEEFQTQNGQTVPGYADTGFAGSANIPAHGAIPRYSLSRNVKSVFGEIVAPILGGETGPELNLSAAGRYDHYSDVGGTFNPKFGATFKPVDWISIRAAWGKSFNAPSLADNENASGSTVFVLSGASANFFAPPADLVASGDYPAYTGGLIIAQRGNAPGIKPQDATTWSVGFDMEPPVIKGLSFGASYYNIKFSNLIGLAPFENPALLYRDFGNLITLSPSQALIDAALAGATIINGPTTAPASGTYAFFDARKRNLGDVKVDGIDFRLNYQHETGFGSVFFGSNGTYELGRKQSSTHGGAFVDVLSKNANRLRVRSMLGAQIGGLLGQVTWNHLSGYDLSPTVGFVGTTIGGQTFTAQDHVGDFNTFDLYFRYELGGEGLGKDLAFTLNVDNVFNQAPPVYRGGSQVAGRLGYANGATIGRFVRLGVSKKF